MSDSAPPVQDDTPAPDAAPAPEVTSGSNEPVDFFGEMPEDIRAYAENKGWAGPGDVINSYQNLEKMVGGRINIPAEDDPDGWNDLYNRLGRPESHDAYELEVPDGSDNEVVDWFRQTAHSIGMTQAQAERFFGSYNEMLQARDEQISAQAEADMQSQMQELRKEWGSGYDTQLSSAQSAAARLGVDEEMVDKMAQSIGLKATLQHFAKIGEAIGEDQFADGNDSSGHAGKIGLTPAQAQAQINDLLADPNFKQRYQRGDTEAVQRISNLFQQAQT